jgi:hypothetical protein
MKHMGGGWEVNSFLFLIAKKIQKVLVNSVLLLASLLLPNERKTSLPFNISSGLFNQGVLLITGSGNLTNVVYP